MPMCHVMNYSTRDFRPHRATFLMAHSGDDGKAVEDIDGAQQTYSLLTV